MASEDVYAQAPLVIEQREIRILSLAPGIGDSALRGDLIVGSLNYDDLHYTALSYTWSGPVSQRSIIVGGVPLQITENLALALLRIRGRDRPKNMWIDAICINQNDNEEKSVQVLLMGDIYAIAARTIVWLGEQSADSDMAMDFIYSFRQRGTYQLDNYSDEDSSDKGSSDEENVGDGYSSDEDRRDEDTTDEDDSGGPISDENSSDDDESGEKNTHAEDTFIQAEDPHEGISDAHQSALQAVTDLMQRQWWTRIWVVQEAPKSHRVTVVCGAKEVDIAYFAQLFKGKKVKELRKGIQVVSQPKEPPLPLEQLFVGMLLTSEQPFVEILSDWYLRKSQTETGGFSLMDLTLLTQRFQASVQKDRIYALLGLVTPDARSWIVPDYSDAMSYRIILVRLTAYFLHFSSRPLRFASHCRATDCP